MSVAKKKKITKILVKYIPTKKNNLLLSFLKENGFQPSNKNMNAAHFQEWILDLSQKLEFKHFVEVIT